MFGVITLLLFYQNFRRLWVGVGCLLIGLLLQGTALAGELVVRSPDKEIYVSIDGKVMGHTELVLPEVLAGDHQLGFRVGVFTVDAFIETVTIPEFGRIVVTVNFKQRKAVISSGAVLIGGNQAATKGNGAATNKGRESATVPADPVPAGPRGDLYIDIEDPAVTVYLNGKQIIEPMPYMVAGLPIGKHTLVAATNCARGEAEIEILEARISRVKPELVPGMGALDIQAAVPGAIVYVDGAEVGPAPAMVDEIPCGLHEIMVRAPGFLQETKTVNAVAFETTQVVAELIKETYGTLVVGVTPLAARVRVDGVDVASGPVTIDTISSGSHLVEVELEKYKSHQENVVVGDGTVSRVDVALAPTGMSASGKRKVFAGSLMGVGFGVGGAGAYHFLKASRAFSDYLEETDNVVADALYEKSVLPNRATALVEFCAAGALVGTSIIVWAKSGVAVSASPNSLRIHGRF
jgi:hypothetical protein